MILAQGNSNEDKTGFLDFVITWLSDYWWLVLSIAGACYFVAALRYWWRSRNGDTDSIAFLVGAFTGAYNGIGKIKPDWIDNVENGEHLQNMAEEIYRIVCERSVDQ